MTNKFKTFDKKASKMLDDIDLSEIHCSINEFLNDKRFVFYPCTGLKDRNGIDIYECDLAIMQDGEVGRVVYKDGAYWFNFDNISQLLFDVADTIEIYGSR